jgi:hypothetical protein
MKNIFILATLLFFSCNLFAAEKIEEIEQFEIRSYSPQKVGVSDLVFEARIDNLTEILSKNTALGKLVDVSFKIYWQSPSQYKIEVNGLPKGYTDIRNDLTMLIKGKLEFVLPEKFIEKFKAYTLTAEPVADGKLIKAIDTTYNMAVPEVDILFDKTGVLRTVETKAANVKSEFYHSPKSWSNNKLVLDKVVMRSMQGLVKQSSTNEIQYASVNGIGFPSKLTIKNVSEMVVPANGKNKEKKVKNETGTVIRFSNYEVNTGKAAKVLADTSKR